MANKYDYVAGPNLFANRGNDGFMISNVDLGLAKTPFTRGEDNFDGSKFEVYMGRPRIADHETIQSLDEECQSFWGTDGGLQAIIDAGIAQLFTRPNYKAHVKDIEDIEDKHTAACDLAANYQIGRKRSTGAAAETKRKASAFDQYAKEAEELGLSMDDLIALAKEKMTE